MARFKIIITLVIIVVILLLLFQSAITGLIISQENNDDQNMFFIYKKFRYTSNVTIVHAVSEIAIGVSTDKDNLNFGIVPTGGSYSTRFIDITNEEDLPVKVVLESFGDILPLVEIKNPIYILQPGDSVKVEVILKTTNETETGNYYGGIEILTVMPKNSFIAPFL